MRASETIDRARLMADIAALAEIGRRGDQGLFRPAFSEDEVEARRWLARKAEKAGLAVRTDAAANLCCRLGPAERPCVMIGSHLDTVPGGGHLDGALGVVAGLECLRRLRETGAPLEHPIELVAFADEEGCYGTTLGSKAMAGLLDLPALDRATNADGESLADAMDRCGFDLAAIGGARREPGSVRAFVELHIEQGPRLEHAGARIGVVEGITGLFRWQVELGGAANHAGTTPMSMRRDAFAGLAEVQLALAAILEEVGSSTSVATIGQVAVEPGAANVICGRAGFSLDVRALDAAVLRALEDRCESEISAIAERRQLDLAIERVSRLEPVACEPAIMESVARAADRLGLGAMQLPSGAAHDAQNLAAIAPMGMIFVPSRGGISHAAAESTDADDIAGGAAVALATLRDLGGAS